MENKKVSISKDDEIKKNEHNNLLENLKNDFFLKILFGNLKTNSKLKIIKYNKAIQNRLNLSNNDYKDYTEIFSEIELEIKPAKNNNGKFIYYKMENEPFFHIYFDDEKEEKRRNYLKQNEVVEKIRIIIDYQITSFCDLFKGCQCIESINFKKFNRKNITNMRGMFSGCISLKDINLSHFITDNVEDMSYMCRFCSLIMDLSLINFDTNNVTNMSFMFTGCSSLINLNISNFNTNNVKDMSSMFYKCISLNDLEITNFIINKKTHVKKMFSQCSINLVMKLKSQHQNIKDEAFDF